MYLLTVTGLPKILLEQAPGANKQKSVSESQAGQPAAPDPGQTPAKLSLV
jgi:hypothetical protein